MLKHKSRASKSLPRGWEKPDVPLPPNPEPEVENIPDIDGTLGC